MEKKQMRFECVSGYVIDDEGTYQIGDEIDKIGAVQSIEEIAED